MGATRGVSVPDTAPATLWDPPAPGAPGSVQQKLLLLHGKEPSKNGNNNRAFCLLPCSLFEGSGVFPSALLSYTWSHTRLNSAHFNCKLRALPVSASLFFTVCSHFPRTAPITAACGTWRIWLSFPPTSIDNHDNHAQTFVTAGPRYKSTKARYSSCSQGIAFFFPWFT